MPGATGMAVATGVGAGAGRAGVLPAQANNPSAAGTTNTALANAADEASGDETNTEGDADNATEETYDNSEGDLTDASDATESVGETDTDTAFRVTDLTDRLTRRLVRLVMCRLRHSSAQFRRCWHVSTVHLYCRDTPWTYRIPWVLSESWRVRRNGQPPSEYPPQLSSGMIHHRTEHA